MIRWVIARSHVTRGKARYQAWESPKSRAFGISQCLPSIHLCSSSQSLKKMLPFAVRLDFKLFIQSELPVDSHAAVRAASLYTRFASLNRLAIYNALLSFVSQSSDRFHDVRPCDVVNNWFPFISLILYHTGRYWKHQAHSTLLLSTAVDNGDL